MQLSRTDVQRSSALLTEIQTSAKSMRNAILTSDSQLFSLAKRHLDLAEEELVSLGPLSIDEICNKMRVFAASRRVQLSVSDRPSAIFQGSNTTSAA